METRKPSPGDAPGVGIMMSRKVFERCGPAIDAIFGSRPWRHVEAGPQAPSSRIDIGYFSRDIFLTSARDVLSDDVNRFFGALDQAGDLSWLQLFSAGADRPVFRRAHGRGATVTTSTGAGGGPVALTAFTGMLMLSRGFPRWLAAQRNASWLDRSNTPPADLAGQTALVIGTGAIGREIARLCSAVGVRCIAARRGTGEVDGFDRSVAYGELDQVVGAVDWVYIACPLSELTRNLVDGRILALCKPGAHLINVGRGEVVDEPALIRALQTGHLAGAYLDVFAFEPLEQASPLWSMPNVVVSPHAAAQSAGYDDRVDAIFLENLRRWLAGEPLVNVAFG